jgi:hypothetical protein
MDGKRFYPNELAPEVVGMHAANPFGANNNSASRGTMAASHFSQKLTIMHGDEKLLQTGFEKEMGRFTFSVKMPVDGRIICILDRYPASVGKDSIPYNPEQYVIYEDLNDHSIGCLNIPRYVSHHQYFGYELKPTPNTNKLTPGEEIAKDTIFMDSPAIGENGGYRYGINLNVALMSHPAVSEDGILISEDVLDKLAFKVYDRRVVEFGKKHYPLNLYGTPEYYKPFPEIGEYIHPSSALMVLREMDESLTPVQMSIYDTIEVDATFDTAIYVRGPKGRVVDIKVYHQEDPTSPTPTVMMDEMDKYARAMTRFFTQVRELESKLRFDHKRKYGTDTIALKPEFHQLVKEAHVYLDWVNKGGKSQSLSVMHRKVPLDDYRIEFVIEYEMKPTLGSKLSDLSGSKGVICQIEKPENMPVDMDGNRADIIMDGGSVLNRMNLGRLYEHYINGAIRDVTKRIKQMLGVDEKDTYRAYKHIKEIYQVAPHKVMEAHNYAMSFYEIVSQPHHQRYLKLTEDQIIEHVAGIVSEGMIVFYPTDNQFEGPDIIEAIESKFKPVYGPVTYVGNSGKRVTTKNSVRIAPIYSILLEKIADNYSSVSSGRLQHFGVLSPITKAEKHTKPWHNSPVRTIGEPEARIIAGYAGREAIAEIMDRNNNPMTHRYIVRRILESQTPTNIQEAVDRDLIPLGGSKPLQLLKHYALCSGFSMVYEPENK